MTDFKVINPYEITEEKLISSTIPEDDYDEWSDVVSYSRGTFVISLATHTVYRSLTNTNLNNDPDQEQLALADPLIEDPDPVNWQVIGATNRYRLFDGKPSVRSSQADEISVVIGPGELIQGLAVFEVDALTVDIRLFDPADPLVDLYARSVAMQDETGIIDAFTYFFSPIIQFSEFILTDIPPYLGGHLELTFERPGSVVSVGQIVVGEIWSLGKSVVEGSGFTGLDFSFIDVDEFGNLTTAIRPATEKHDFEIWADNVTLGSFKRRMKSLRGGKGAVWISTEDTRLAAFSYGFALSYRNVYTTRNQSLISVEVQGKV